MANSIFTPLYFANYFVDQVQDAKNKVVDTFVYDTKMKESIKSFVEAQREFTKQVNRTTNEVVELSTVAFKEVAEKAQRQTPVGQPATQADTPVADANVYTPEIY